MIANLIIFSIIGIVAGFIAGRLFQGSGFGLVGNLVVGIAGSFMGGWVFGLLGLRFPFRIDPFIASIITATIGALILLFLISFIKKR